MAKSAGHYFSLRSLLTRKPAPERDSGFPFRLSLPTVAPGPFAGALRFVSLALHILPHKGERRRRNVLARKVSDHFSTRKRISLQLNCRLPRTPPQKTRSTQQAWMNSRNLTTITTAQKHRQLVFLHPTSEYQESASF